VFHCGQRQCFSPISKLNIIKKIKEEFMKVHYNKLHLNVHIPLTAILKSKAFVYANKNAQTFRTIMTNTASHFPFDVS
jgi:hypothetical protein